MAQQFLIIAIILLPVQTFSLFLMGSRYDLSAFVLLLLAVLIVARYGIRARSAFALICFVLLHVALLSWFEVAPYYRVFSGVVWLGGLVYFLLEGKRVAYSQDVVFKLLVLVLGISALYIWLQFAALGYERPSAWFHEPSFAGLCLYSAAAGLLVSLVLVRCTPRLQVLLVGVFLVLFSAAVLTFSMHIVTFLITLGVIGVFLWVPRILSFSSVRFRLRTPVVIGVFGVFLIVVARQLLQMEHFIRRIEFANPSNYSLLSWLRGLDQMIAAMRASFLFGMGLGSVGFFDFQSRYSDILAMLGKPELNLTDAYSLAFRLVIEIGLPMFVAFLFYLAARMRAFARYAQSPPQTDGVARVAVVFNFVFAVTVIAGCLLKEPLYPQSFLYLAVLLVASIPLGVGRGRSGDGAISGRGGTTPGDVRRRPLALGGVGA